MGYCAILDIQWSWCQILIYSPELVGYPVVTTIQEKHKASKKQTIYIIINFPVAIKFKIKEVKLSLSTDFFLTLYIQNIINEVLLTYSYFISFLCTKSLKSGV